MSDAVLADFFQRLGVMLEAGLPLTRALASLGRERRAGVRRLARELADGVTQGLTFAGAAAAHPGFIDPGHLPLLQAGEQSGRLPETLKRLADGLERRRQLRVSIGTSLLYPILIFHLAVLVLTVVKMFLRFTGGGLQIGFSLAAGLWFAASVLVPVYGVVVGVWLVWRAGRQRRGLRAVLEAVVAAIPGFGKLRWHLAVARFARALEGLYAAGVNLGRAVSLAADAADHELLRRRLRPVADAVAAGESLAQAVAAADVFAPDVTALITTGVESGHLDAMLVRAAAIEEDRAANAAKVIGVLLPLLVTLLVGAVLVYFIIQVFASYVGQINGLLNG